MLPNIESSLQRLTTLGDIVNAPGRAKDEDYFQLKRDYDNLVISVTAIIDAVNGGEFSPLSGTGSPEGVVAANYSLFYVDTATGDIYFNPTFGADTGWTVTT